MSNRMASWKKFIIEQHISRIKYKNAIDRWYLKKHNFIITLSKDLLQITIYVNLFYLSMFF